MATQPDAQTEAGTPRRMPLWPWALLGVATGIAAVIVVLNLWNSQLELTQARLEAARALWKAAGPSDYDIEVQVQGGVSSVYHVKVRDRKIQSATVNGNPFDRPEAAYPWTVPGLFDVVMQEDLDQDSKPDCPPAYTQAEFDPKDGHPIRYLRTTDRQRIQIEVKLTKMP
jgi:hypothetical protein